MPRAVPSLLAEGRARGEVPRGKHECWGQALPMATRSGEARIKGPVVGSRKEKGLRDHFLQGAQSAPSAPTLQFHTGQMGARM